MNLRPLFFLLCLLVVTSCSVTKLNKSVVSAEENSVLYHPKLLNSDSEQLIIYECNDFVSKALDIYTIAFINKNFLGLLDCSIESVVNIHNHAVVDSIFTYSNPQNKIQIYRAKHNDFVFTFDVTDPKLKLIGNIYTGMKKDIFSKKFNIKVPLNDIIQIQNADSTMKFIFYFNNNILKRIDSYIYID